MILVMLGTQKNDFSRLLKEIEKCIDNGIIKDVTSKSLTATISLRAKSGKPYKKNILFSIYINKIMNVPSLLRNW